MNFEYFSLKWLKPIDPQFKFCDCKVAKLMALSIFIHKPTITNLSEINTHNLNEINIHNLNEIG